MGLDPPHIETIRQMRAAGADERSIARQLGASRRRLWNIVSAWNVRHPDRPLPPAARLQRAPRYARIATMLNAGHAVTEVAAAEGITVTAVRRHMHTARTKGLLPYPSDRERAPRDMLKAMRGKGATPPLGHIGDVMDILGQDGTNDILARLDRNDATIAACIGRLLKELMNEPH